MENLAFSTNYPGSLDPKEGKESDSGHPGVKRRHSIEVEEGVLSVADLWKLAEHRLLCSDPHGKSGIFS